MKSSINSLHPLFDSIDNDSVLSPVDIAELLNVSLETVRRWCRSGKLSAYSFGGRYIIMGMDFKEFLAKAKNKTNAERILSGEQE